MKKHRPEGERLIPTNDNHIIPMSIEVYVEPAHPANHREVDDLLAYVESVFKNAAKRVKNGAVITVVRKSDGGMTMDISGKASAKLRSDYEEIFRKYGSPK